MSRTPLRCHWLNGPSVEAGCHPLHLSHRAIWRKLTHQRGQPSLSSSASPVAMYFPAQRLLCPIALPRGLTVYSCCGCAWFLSVESDDPAGPEAFETHRCEDFPIVSDFFAQTELPSNHI